MWKFMCLYWTLSLNIICAISDVTVLQEELTYEQLYSLEINSSVEYILQFSSVPHLEIEENRPCSSRGSERELLEETSSEYPTKIWIQTSAGDIAHPVLLTARQNTGVATWQLPYQIGDVTMYQLERTLCFQYNGINNSSCNDETFFVRNEFYLHVSSSCSASISVVATHARDWRLEAGSVMETTATIWAPTVHFYNFTGLQDSVRLIITSSDEVCARVSVQNFTCPVLQTDVDFSLAGLRMTMLQSGAVFLKKDKFPDGFYVVVVVLGSEEECTGSVAEEEPWLFDTAVLGIDHDDTTQTTRSKNITISIQTTINQGQYALAASLTLAMFLLFYVMFLALIYAQRWPKFAKYVSPKAPLSDVNTVETVVETDDVTATSNEAPSRQRRRSVQTLDSSSNSISDEESDQESTIGVASPASSIIKSKTTRQDNGETQQENGIHTTHADSDQGPSQIEQVAVGSGSMTTPFGVPRELRVAVLSRHQERVLRARSDRYLYTLYTVAVFYTLPVVQFVAAFQIFFNVSGSLDMCYYNFLCSHPVGELSDFNHVWSNTGYLLLGALFMLQVRRRRTRRRTQPKNEEYGIPAHYGLLSSLGAGMMVVALLSASYHLCPNRLNFQFDTAFMYVLSVVSMVKIYQSRHPDINARAHSTFGVLAVLMALVVWGVLGGGGLFWGMFTVLHIFTFLLLSIRIYYLGQFRFEKETIQMAARGLASLPKYGVQPLYKTRLVLLLIANAVNWAFALYGLWQQAGDFASHLLQVLLGNTLMYMVFYLVMKLLHGERPRWYAWCYLAGAALFWGPSLYFFISGSSDWSTTPAQSRELNHQCVVLEFYDSHDLWHLLSSVALYLSFNAMLTWDDGLSEIKRTEIAVF